MKRPVIIAFVILISFSAYSQLILTYKNNAPVPGDSVVYREIKYLSPGEEGQDQVWDFSKIQDTGRTFTSYVNPLSAKEYRDAGDYNVVYTDDEYTYYNMVSEGSLTLKGVTSDRISLTYTDPAIRMKFPFTYTDHFRDLFVSDAIKDAVMAIRSDGELEVSADACGTLVFPEKIVRNTLRIKTEKNMLEVGPCGLADRRSVQYQWYAPGYRYPVLTMCERQVFYNGQNMPVVTKESFLTLQQGSPLIYASGMKTQMTEANDQGPTVLLWPNPFSDKLNYCYHIDKQMTVRIGLYDMDGKLIMYLARQNIKDNGLYTGSLDATSSDLPPGVYYIKFSFDEKTTVSKVVKL